VILIVTLIVMQRKEFAFKENDERNEKYKRLVICYTAAVYESDSWSEKTNRKTKSLFQRFLSYIFSAAAI